MYYLHSLEGASCQEWHQGSNIRDILPSVKKTQKTTLPALDSFLYDVPYSFIFFLIHVLEVALQEIYLCGDCHSTVTYSSLTFNAMKAFKRFIFRNRETSIQQFIPSSHMTGFLCKLKEVGLLFSVGMKGARK